MAYLRMQGITKLYTAGSVLANDAVDFNVEENEIHAVVGENGAGKSTLMSILYGFYQADAGEVHVDGNVVSIRSPDDAIDVGIVPVIGKRR